MITRKRLRDWMLDVTGPIEMSADLDWDWTGEWATCRPSGAFRINNIRVPSLIMTLLTCLLFGWKGSSKARKAMGWLHLKACRPPCVCSFRSR